MRRTKGMRHAAVRRAQQAKQERDAARLRRERQVEAALVGYFEHTEFAEAVETLTAAKVLELQETAAREAGQARKAAALAVREMADLGETRAAIADLTGLTVGGVRELLQLAATPVLVELHVPASEWPGSSDVPAGHLSDGAADG